MSQARGDARRYEVIVVFFALKKEYLTLPELVAIPGQNESVVSLKKHADLNLRMEFITLAILERMRLACCVLPQRKALYICVCFHMKCIFHLAYS